MTDNSDKRQNILKEDFVMKKKVVAWFLLLAMMITLIPARSVQAAEKELYLAYQKTGYGETVTSLDEVWREDYKVTELFLDQGEKVDLCFINASFWKSPKWTSSNTKVATVDSAGVITAVSPGEAEITLTYTKKITGKKISASAKVYVGEDNWDINIAASGLSCSLDTYELKIGSRLELDLFENKPNINSEQRSTYANQAWVSVNWEGTNNYAANLYGKRVVAEHTGSSVITATITNNVLKTSIVKQITVNVTKPAYDENVEWNNMYYQMYGENYKRMFKTAALNSTADIEFDMLDDAWLMLNKKMQVIGISGFSELADLSNGLTIAFEGMLNGKNYHVEEGHREAMLHLIKEITANEGINEHYVNNVKEALEKAQGLISEVKYVQDFSEAIEKIEKAGLEIPKTEQNTIVNYIMNDAVGDIKKVLSEGVTIGEYMALTMCLYEMDSKILDDLQKCSKPGKAIYEDVELIREEKAKDPEKYFKEKYGNDAFARVAVAALIKLAGKEAMGVLEAASQLVVMMIDMAGVPKLSTLTKCTYLMSYTACAQERIRELREEICNNFDSYSNKELQEKIDEYETVHRLFLAISEVTLEAISDIDNTCYWALYDDRCLASGNYYYDTHIATAMSWYLNQNPTADEHELVKPVASNEQGTGTVEANNNLSVREKLDVLYSLLGNKYCTVDQKSCTTKRQSSHGCDNCNMSDITKAAWFKNIFGEINVDNFPEHDVNSSRRDYTGQSCFGWGCFAQWYVYADSANEKIEGKRIATVKFNKTNMEKYVQPGDVVRVNGHSVLVYSIEDNGIMVLDSNWNSGGQLNCLVQKHLLSYSNENYAGYTAYINRVEKVIDSENKAGQFGVSDISTDQILVLKNGEKNLSVQYFQQNLYYLGYTVGDFDGDFGKKTSTAVKNLQKDLKMEQTGEVNMYLYRLVNNSMKEIQLYLKEKGYYSSEIDGIAGTGTSKAITKLQKEWGMNATGRVTVEFMQKIVEKTGASAVQNLAEYVKLSK